MTDTHITSASAAVELVQRWVEVVNRGDAAGLRALFVPDAVVVDDGRTFSGIDAIMRWSDSSLIGAACQIYNPTIEPSLRGATLNAEYRSNGYGGAGDLAFTIGDGLIQRIDI